MHNIKQEIIFQPINLQLFILRKRDSTWRETKKLERVLRGWLQKGSRSIQHVNATNEVQQLHQEPEEKKQRQQHKQAKQ